MRSQTAIYALISLAIAVFLWHSLGFDFVQDDAYISYRYVANYLHGDGLVFNAGERIEGFTNFGWVLYLLLCGVVGLNYVALSKLAGIFLGAATVFITYMIAERCLDVRNRWFALSAVALVAFNLSLAYWSQAGLETAAFVFLVSLGLYLFLIRNWLLIAVLAFAVLVRPEGALLAGLLIIIEAVEYRRVPRFSLLAVAGALVLSLPLLGFKLAYYGSILPNPFYAKTGFDSGQLLAGIDYAARFFSHYPYFAVVLVILPFFWRKLPRAGRSIWLFSVFYVLYVVLVGGDVLKVHRFFLPVLPALAVAAALLLSHITMRFRPWPGHAVTAVVTVGLVAATLLVPRGFIDRYAALEAALTHKMAYLAGRLKDTNAANFSVATSTIGRFSYGLLGHRVIDLLGLTDSTVARHPEPQPPDMETSWRERNFNTPYILGEAPDYIMFSTGFKPSAPAERALLTYRQFLDCYRGACFHYLAPGSAGPGVLLTTYRQVCEPEPPFVPAYSLEFVNLYNRGTNAQNAGRFSEADSLFRRAARQGGDPPYVYLLLRQAMNAFLQGDTRRGEALQNEILRLDSNVAEVQADLYVYEHTIGNREKAAVHRRWLEKLAPWLLSRYDSIAVARAGR